MSDFHRFIDPTYFESSLGPFPGLINSNDYDRVNVTDGGVGLGGSSPADVAKVGGPTPGTYFVSFGEDGTSFYTNRGFRALAQNTDLLDDLLHRDLAVPKISAQFPNVAGTASFTIVENGVFVGSVGTPANDATRGGIIGLVDDDGGSSQGQPLHVFTGGSYQAVKITAIAGFGTGFGNSPLITVSPTIPAGVAFKVVYYTRQSPASQPEDLVVDVRTFEGAWEADIWAFARNILEINQTFNGVITFANTVIFSGPVSFPFGLQAPVVLNGVADFDAFTINQTGLGGAFIINIDNTTDPAVSLISIPSTGTVNTTGGAEASVVVYGRENLGAGLLATGGAAYRGFGGDALLGTGASPGGAGGVFEGGDPLGIGVIATSGSNGIGLYARGIGALSVGIDAEGDEYGVKGVGVTYGVSGVGGTFGVYGLNSSTVGYGVVGQSNSTNILSGGVQGISVGGSAVQGFSTGNTPGAAAGYFLGVNVGAVGQATAAVQGVGVSGQAFGVGGTGVKGVGVNVSGFGVWGSHSGPGGIGVFGSSGVGQPGVFGLGTTGVGVQGVSGSGAGVLGQSFTSTGVDGIGGINKPGGRFIGGSSEPMGDGNNAHGVVGTGGGTGIASGVFGIGALNGTGVTGQGTGTGTGVFGVGGADEGIGGVAGVGGFGKAENSIGVVGLGAGYLPGQSSVIRSLGGFFLGAGKGVGIVSQGGGTQHNDFEGAGSAGGIFVGGPWAHGVMGFPGIEQDLGDNFRGYAGVAGYGYGSSGTKHGQYGVLGVITSEQSLDADILDEPSGVRGSVDIPGFTADVFSFTRSIYGGVFSGTGDSSETGWQYFGGYGAKVEGSKSRADLRMPPRFGFSDGDDTFSDWTPVAGRVGDMFFHESLGLCICMTLEATTGLAEWYHIPIVRANPDVDAFGPQAATLNWIKISKSELRDPRALGTGDEVGPPTPV